MVMLSEFLRFPVVDANRHHRVLRDLVVDLSDEYPRVTQLLISRSGHASQVLRWTAVKAIDWHARRLHVTAFDTAEPAASDALEQAVLLKRDVLDAMILDLVNRTATPANDLWLRAEHDQLILRAADVSPWAIIRRLSRGLLARGTAEGLLDWKDVEFLRGDPAAVGAGRDYHRRVASFPPGVIANLIAAVPYLHAAELLSLLPDPLAADVLEVMRPERQIQVFEELQDEHAVRLLPLMAPDAAADLLARLTPEMAQRYLKQLPHTVSDRLVELLRYPADTAGGLMTNDVIVAPAALTVAEACEAIRDQLAEPDFVYYLYVVDTENERHLRGVVTMRDLLLAEDTRRLEGLMHTHLETLDPLEPARDAAQRVVDASLVALPVVGRDGRLLGAVTADAAVGQLAPRSWREQAPRVFS